MKNLIMIFCQYYECIHIAALTLLHFNFLLKFMYGVFVLWSPSFLWNSDQLNLLYISKSIASKETDIYYVRSAPIVQFANYFMSPGNCEKQSHRCQSASSWTHFNITPLWNNEITPNGLAQKGTTDFYNVETKPM